MPYPASLVTGRVIGGQRRKAPSSLASLANGMTSPAKKIALRITNYLFDLALFYLHNNHGVDLVFVLLNSQRAVTVENSIKLAPLHGDQQYVCVLAALLKAVCICVVILWLCRDV